MIVQRAFSKAIRTLACVGCLAGTTLAGVRLAAEPAQPVASSVAISDVTLAHDVLAAIDADPMLKNVNLLVSVVDRGVVIGGPVTSEEIKKRVEAVVRGVPGIQSVKNVCFIEADPDPLLRAATKKMKLGSQPSGSLTLPSVVTPPDAPNGVPPIPEAIEQVVIVPNTVVVQHPNLSKLPVTGILGAPVSPAKPISQIQTVAPGALTAAKSALPADTATAVAAIRANDSRFANLKVEMKPDGWLLVTGAVANPSDAWDFAAEVRKLAGVARIGVDPKLVR